MFRHRSTAFTNGKCWYELCQVSFFHMIFFTFCDSLFHYELKIYNYEDIVDEVQGWISCHFIEIESKCNLINRLYYFGRILTKISSINDFITLYVLRTIKLPTVERSCTDWIVFWNLNSTHQLPMNCVNKLSFKVSFEM